MLPDSLRNKAASSLCRTIHKIEHTGTPWRKFQGGQIGRKSTYPLKFSIISLAVDQEIDVELSLQLTLYLKFSHCYHLSRPIKHTFIVPPGGVTQYVLNGLIKICPISLMPIWRSTFLKIAIKYITIYYLGRKKNHHCPLKINKQTFNDLILYPTLQIYNGMFLYLSNYIGQSNPPSWEF